MIPFSSPKGFFPGNPYVLWNSRPAKNGQPPPCYGQCNINIGTRKVGAAMKRLPQIHMGPKAKEQILQRWDPVSRTIVNVRCPCTNQDVFSDSAPPPLPPPLLEETDAEVISFYAKVYVSEYTDNANDLKIHYEISFQSSLSDIYTGTYRLWAYGNPLYEGASVLPLTENTISLDSAISEYLSTLSTSDVVRNGTVYVFGQVIFYNSVTQQSTFIRTPIITLTPTIVKIESFIIEAQEFEDELETYRTTFQITLSGFGKEGYQINIYNNQANFVEYIDDTPVSTSTGPPLVGLPSVIIIGSVPESDIYNSFYYAVVVDNGVRIYSNIVQFTPP